MACSECGKECDGPNCGTHAAGCFYGGPPGEGYWFAVYGCEHPHEGDLDALWAPAANARAAWDHLQQAGLSAPGALN